MQYQPAPPVVGSFGVGDAYSPPPAVGVGSAYSDALAAVGLSPDNPDGMYDQLQFFFRDPVGFKNAQKGWHGPRTPSSGRRTRRGPPPSSGRFTGVSG